MRILKDTNEIQNGRYVMEEKLCPFLLEKDIIWCDIF